MDNERGVYVNEASYNDPELAEIYELLNGWAVSDDFYLDQVMDANSVLDVGCGTGLILRTAREHGHTGRLVGLDPADAMLDVARRHRGDIDWIRGYLSEISFDSEFDLIFMSGHAFQEFVTDIEIARSLRAIRTALTDDGTFIFETRNPDNRPWEAWIPEHAVEISHPEGGVVHGWNDVQLPVDGDVVTFVSRCTGPGFEGTKEVSATLRFLDCDQLTDFLNDAGLVIETQYGYWDRSPISASSPEIITVAHRV